MILYYIMLYYIILYYVMLYYIIQVCTCNVYTCVCMYMYIYIYDNPGDTLLGVPRGHGLDQDSSKVPPLREGIASPQRGILWYSIV